MVVIYKYPRTPHVEGSGIQYGDEDLSVLPMRMLQGKHLVIEEKVDGANSAISFDSTGQLLLQSRGHYLNGGPRETQFQLLKSWAHTHTIEFWDALHDRYILYGEWLYAKHTVFYTDLPHYFLEFDIYDKQKERFFNTEKRRMFLKQLPFVCSARVVYEGKLKKNQQLVDFIQPSPYIKSNHLQQLYGLCLDKHLDSERTLKETDPSILMEGLYIKIEDDNVVQERWKYVRASFQQAMTDSESHWMHRTIIPNLLSKGVTLF